MKTYESKRTWHHRPKHNRIYSSEPMIAINTRPAPITAKMRQNAELVVRRLEQVGELYEKIEKLLANKRDIIEFQVSRSEKILYIEHLDHLTNYIDNNQWRFPITLVCLHSAHPDSAFSPVWRVYI